MSALWYPAVALFQPRKLGVPNSADIGTGRLPRDNHDAATQYPGRCRAGDAWFGGCLVPCSANGIGQDAGLAAVVSARQVQVTVSNSSPMKRQQFFTDEKATREGSPTGSRLGKAVKNWVEIGGSTLGQSERQTPGPIRRMKVQPSDHN